MVTCKLLLAGLLVFPAREQAPEIPAQAAGQLEDGLHFLRENQLLQTNQDLARVLRSGGTTPQFYALVASVLGEFGKSEQALKVLQEGRARYPNSAEILAEMGTIYVELKDYETSIPLLRRALELKPEQETYRYNLGVAYHKQGVQAYAKQRYFDGLFLARQALQLDTEIADFHHLLGICFLALEQHTDAEQALRRALELATDRPGFLYDLALLYIAQETFQEAEPLLEQATKLQPDFGHAYYFLGVSYRNVGKAQRAVETLQKALILEPALKEKEIHYHLGNCYRLLGKFRLAIQEFEKEVSVNPDSLVAQLDLADLYLGERNYPKALEHANQATTISHTEPRAHLLRGRAYLGLESYQEALTSFQRTTELDPELAEAYYLMSRAHLGAGRSDLARKELEIYQRLKGANQAISPAP